MIKRVFLTVTVASLFVTGCKNKEQSPTEKTAEVSQETTTTAYELDMNKTKLTWTAYKTPDKVGVSGTFKDIKVTGQKKSMEAENVLSGAQFIIDGATVSSGDNIRDPKLVEFFFQKLAVPTISGTFGTFADGKVDVIIKMNDIDKEIPMEYTLEDKKMTITGKIDMVEDFQASDAFNAIHEACKDLHLGKTWTDVSLEVVTEL